jgi:hypothetical protein
MLSAMLLATANLFSTVIPLSMLISAFAGNFIINGKIMSPANLL